MIPGAKPEVRVFATVFLIALIAMTLYISNWSASSSAVKATKKVTNTIVLSGINVGDAIGKDIPSLGEFHLLGLADGVMITGEGMSVYKQFLRLTADDFTGGQVLYTTNEQNILGNYLYFPSAEPMFEYSMVFSPPLESKIDDGVLTDLEDEYLEMLGDIYAFLEAKLNTNTKTVSLKLFGMGSMIEFTDKYSDSSFSQGASVNGKNINAHLKITGAVSGDAFQISTIVYRPFADALIGNDVYVVQKHGVRELLREPEAMLSPSFDIIYGGVREERIETKPITSSNTVMFKPRDNGYRIIFTNNNGQRYSVPLADSSGSFKYGDESRDLVYIEGSSQSDFSIDLGDYFVATSKNEVNGITNILRYDRINFDAGAVYFDDLAGGSKEVLFNTVSGAGALTVAGKSYQFYVNTNAPYSIAFDLNGDGDVNSDEANIIILGGARIDLGASNTPGSEISMRFITPARLFDEPDADETVNIRLSSAPALDLEVASGVTLKKDEKSGLKLGLTNFGVFFVLNEKKDPPELEIEFPAKGGKSALPAILSPQAKALVVVTLEREKLMGLAKS